MASKKLWPAPRGSLLALVSEVSVESVQQASKTFGMILAFVGFVVVALVAAAEMTTAVSGARKNRPFLSLGTALGSTSQTLRRPSAGAAQLRHRPGAATQNRIISIQSERAENLAELFVSDNGLGIPEDKLTEIFEPFFTSKAEGMGMGLSIGRTIIETHDGSIWAENRDYGGESFRVRLPLIV